ncbi:MAG: cell division protein FtsL [Thermoleophilia bacterium]
MARTAQQDWGFTEITRKFERDSKPARQRAPGRRRVSVSASGTMHVGIWLSAVAICLLGLVAVHVSILKKNMEFNELIREKNTLSADNARLSSEVAGLSSPERIEQIATQSLGMVSPEKVQYVYIGPSEARQNYANLDTFGAGGGRTAAP